MATRLGINKVNSTLYLCGLGIQHEKIQQESGPQVLDEHIYATRHSFPAGTSCGSSISKAQHRAQDSSRAVHRRPTETFSKLSVAPKSTITAPGVVTAHVGKGPGAQRLICAGKQHIEPAGTSAAILL